MCIPLPPQYLKEYSQCSDCHCYRDDIHDHRDSEIAKKMLFFFITFRSGGCFQAFKKLSLHMHLIIAKQHIAGSDN